MYPIIFEKNTPYADCISGGMGLGMMSNALSCKINKSLDGTNALTIEYPTNGYNASKIIGGRRLLVQDDSITYGGRDTLQMYDIYHISRPTRGVIKIKSCHHSYALSGILIKPCAVVSNTGITSMVSAIYDNYHVGSNNDNILKFVNYGDIGHYDRSYYSNAIKSFRNLIYNGADSIYGLFGAGIDIYDDASYGKLCVTINVVPYTHATPFFEGVDVENIDYTYDGSDAFDAVMPYWKKGDTTVYCSRSVDATANQPPALTRTIPYDVSKQFESEPTDAQLIAAGRAYMAESGRGAAKEKWVIKPACDVSDRRLGYAVPVVRADGSVITSRITSIVYDVLNEKTTGITLGETASLYGAIKGVK